MPKRGGVQVVVRRVFHRWPMLERLVFSAMDLAYQVPLLPFRRRAVRGRAIEHAALVDKTVSYNDAAERYFATFPDREFLIRKPFSDREATARHLIDAGVLIRSLRLRPGDRILEIGAGTCWLSHMLNRFGCRTVAVDVSPTVLAIGREVFARDASTDWSLEPQFLTYDGYTLPLGDSSCDGIIVNDAFHHVPNQRDLLREMHRVLSPEGMVFMSEPGGGHASAAHSRDESAKGVLENELVLEDLSALARECGFSDVNVVVAGSAVRQEVPAAQLNAFMGGKGFPQYWKALCHDLEHHHYILMYRSSAAPTTRRPSTLSAMITLLVPGSLTVSPDQRVNVSLRVRNGGDTRWLSRGRSGDGQTRVGAHLYRDGSPPELIDFDWCRFDLSEDIGPGTVAHVAGVLPSLPGSGRYLVEFDLVVEGMTWFAEHGSPPAILKIMRG